MSIRKVLVGGSLFIASVGFAVGCGDDKNDDGAGGAGGVGANDQGGSSSGGAASGGSATGGSETGGSAAGGGDAAGGGNGAAEGCVGLCTSAGFSDGLETDYMNGLVECQCEGTGDALEQEACNEYCADFDVAEDKSYLTVEGDKCACDGFVPG